MFEFIIPTGLKNKARGCGTPLPWVGNCPNSRLPQRGCGTVVQLPYGKTDVTPLE
ncbi:MAG: hypothetical protein BWX80_03700 [Candidatus Hydrogenedentes bacterium ADurb.Bin101]|nr:MAG: hypothetical protein BWX80_03700 [Candidatus Hydrogenedentes bacterium ADurb.Bin101]